MSSLDIFSHLLSIFNFFLFICRSCLHWRLFFCYIYYKHFHSITVIHLKLKVTIFKKSNTPSLYIGPGFSLCFLIKKTKTTINGSRFCRKSLYPALHFFEDWGQWNKALIDRLSHMVRSSLPCYYYCYYWKSCPRARSFIHVHFSPSVQSSNVSSPPLTEECVGLLCRLHTFNAQS